MNSVPRRNRLKTAALVLPLLLVATSACDLAMADYKIKETAEWRKTFPLSAGGSVDVSNVNGKIDVDPATGNEVEIVAIKTARASTSEAAKEALGRIEIIDTSTPASVHVETKVPKGQGLFSGSNTEVEYKVRVPAGAEVKVTTVNGGIQVTDVSGRVKAEAINGGVKGINISNAIEATTVNGGVEVDLSRMPEGGVKLECTNGGIKLRLPSDAKASISARVTNGGIDTSGLQIETSGEKSRNRLDAQLNGGGPRISIEGTNGGIRISGR